MKFPWWSRVISGMIGIFITVSTGMWAGFKLIQSEVDSGKKEAIQAAKEGEERVMKYIEERRQVRDAEFRAVHEKIEIKSMSLQTQLASMDRKLEILIQRRSRASVVERPEELYTKTRTEQKSGEEI